MSQGINWKQRVEVALKKVAGEDGTASLKDICAAIEVPPSRVKSYEATVWAILRHNPQQFAKYGRGKYGMAKPGEAEVVEPAAAVAVVNEPEPEVPEEVLA